MPVTPTNTNYASIVTVFVIALAGVWYMLSAHRQYHGPPSGECLEIEVKEQNVLEIWMSED
ncbi:hypothetical protein JVU11DRAFT_8359 [Chiua virens]|nr:hypothetical protein JVU11DRAFT_8359 [Chiua virens]